MSIKTTYNLHNIQIVDAIIRIDRLWGSSKEGWSSLVGIYTEETIPATAAVGVEGEEGYLPSVPSYVRRNKITEFNRSCLYDESKRGYVSMYESLTTEFGGVMV